MAIYHFTVKTFSRAKGRNAIAAAAYRHGQNFLDEKTGRCFHFTNKKDVEYSELLIPENAPEWVKDLAKLDSHEASQKLWNAVEAFEKRKDAQTAREVEFSLPHELTSEQRLDLAREFIRDNFTSKGMIADFVIHNHFDGEEKIEKPHVHVMLTMRELTDKRYGLMEKLKSYIGLSVTSSLSSALSSEIAFGEKVREWNSKNLVREWRKNWADSANHHLSKAGLDVRIDHRSYKEQGIEFEPQPKLGKSVHEMSRRGQYVDRFQEMIEIQKRNRILIRKNPGIVLDYITRYQSTFTRQDIAKVLNRYIDKVEEFRNLLGRVEASPNLLVLTGNLEGVAVKLTTKEMIKIESQIAVMASTLSEKSSCPPHLSAIEWYLEKDNERLKEIGGLSSDQHSAIRHMVSSGQLKVIVGYAGAGKTTSLEIAKEIWSSSGYRIVGAAPTGRAVANLEALGIPSKTLHKWDYEWERGNERLNNRSILILDEAGMVDSRRLHSLLSQSKEKGFKIVLVGDPEQLSPIEAGAPVRAIMEQVGFAELSNVVRQKSPWQQEATQHLATRQTMKALETYHQKNHIHYSTHAKERLIQDWAADYKESQQDDKKNKEEKNRPEKNPSKLILAYTNKEVRDLNQLARNEARKAGQLLGHDQVLSITKPLNLETLDKIDADKASYKAPRLIREDRAFAVGDQIVFLKNDYGLDIRNGQLGRITDMQEGFLTVLKENKKEITFDIDAYGYIDHGYATTIHKSQGTTVDKTFMYASLGMDSHLTYVALSRHKDDVQIYANADIFDNKDRLFKEFSKEIPKENALDYALDQTQSLASDLPFETQRSFMQRRSLSSSLSPASSYLSWESIKETAQKTWSEAKDWMFGDTKVSQEEGISAELVRPENRWIPENGISRFEEPSLSVISDSPSLLKVQAYQQKEELPHPVESFHELIKERDAMPFALYQTPQQSKRTLEIRDQLDSLGSQISKSLKLLETAKTLGLESAVRIAASSYDMKISQDREKALGRDRGIGY